VYTVEKDVHFNNLPPMLNDNCSQRSRLVLTKDDVDKKLHLKTEKSPGPDKLHPRVLYETHSVIYPLFLIYSKSLQSGELPLNWKLAEVTDRYIRRVQK